MARLAGLPLAVIDRARAILAGLENENPAVRVSAPAPDAARPKKKIAALPPADDSQLNLL